MKCFFLFFSLLAISTKGFCQITFSKTYGGPKWDRPREMKQTTDSGFIITGYTNYPVNEKVYLIKTDKNGDTLWTKTFGGDMGRSVQQTTDNGFIVVGNISDTGSAMILLIKTDGAGNELWRKTYNGRKYASANIVQQLGDGGYIIGGSTNGYQQPEDPYLIRTNTNGDTLWTKTYAESYIVALQQTPDGGFIIGSDYFIPLDGYFSLTKTDSGGNSLWSKVFDKIDSTVSIRDIKINNRGYILLCNGLIPLGIEHFYLIQTDMKGDTLWTKQFGGYTNGVTKGGYDTRTIQQTNDSNYIIGGLVSNDFGVSDSTLGFMLMKTDTGGNMLWVKTYSPAFPGNYMDGRAIQTYDNGYAITGGTYVGLDYDIILIKTDSLGNHIAGINEGVTETTNTITIFPNPGKCTITIQINEKWKMKDGRCALQMYDLLGREVLHSTLTNSSSPIDISGLQSGMYFYQLTGNETIIGQGKFIVE